MGPGLYTIHASDDCESGEERLPPCAAPLPQLRVAPHCCRVSSMTDNPACTPFFVFSPSRPSRRPLRRRNRTRPVFRENSSWGPKSLMMIRSSWGRKFRNRELPCETATPRNVFLHVWRQDSNQSGTARRGGGGGGGGLYLRSRASNYVQTNEARVGMG